MATVSVLGAGRMGHAIARALVGAGHEVWVWNRTPEKLASLVQLGACAAANVRDAVERSDASVVMVRDYRASDELLREREVEAALRGKTLVELTSGTPADARGRAAWAAANGIAYVDGVVLVTPDLVGTPRCTVLASGSAQRVDAIPWLALGGRVIHVGEQLGQAAALDTALIATLWGAMFSALWGARICQVEGVPVAQYGALLRAMQQVSNDAVERMLDRIARDAHAADISTRAALDVHRVGVEHLRAACREAGISTELPDAFAGPLARAAAAGNGDAELSVLVRYL